MTDTQIRLAARAALEWMIELGADEAICEAPVDCTQLPSRSVGAQSLAPPRKQAPAPPKPQPSPIDDARSLAQSAQDLPALKAALEGFEGSSLKKHARNCVFADGAPQADLMIIGEAPGREEDREGLPFVGRSGKLLDLMLAAIGRSRRADDPKASAYITNVIPYRPLENRTPDDAEVQCFSAFMTRHIELMRPKAILCLGNVPAKHVMGARSGITRYRGSWVEQEHAGRLIPLLASFHPAYLLRSPDMKRHAWRDLIALRKKLDAL